VCTASQCMRSFFIREMETLGFLASEYFEYATVLHQKLQKPHRFFSPPFTGELSQLARMYTFEKIPLEVTILNKALFCIDCCNKINNITTFFCSI